MQGRNNISYENAVAGFSTHSQKGLPTLFWEESRPTLAIQSAKTPLIFFCNSVESPSRFRRVSVEIPSSLVESPMYNRSAKCRPRILQILADAIESWISNKRKSIAHKLQITGRIESLFHKPQYNLGSPHYFSFAIQSGRWFFSDFLY